MKLFVAYLIALHVFAAALFVRSDTFESWVDQGPSDYIKRMRSIHGSIDPVVPAGASIFLGDSITQRLAVAAVTPKAVNFGIGSQTSSELIESIRKYESLNRAKTVYLLIGINDFASDKVQGIEDRLKMIANGLPNDVPLIWSGIMPVKKEPAWNHRIKKINDSIQDICRQRGSCVYVDTHETLTPLNHEAFVDGLHLSEEGYRAWISSLKFAAQSL